jgi:beta-phosphoglucomutase
MHKLKGFIFDMDGTLLNNMAFHKQAWHGFLQEKGVQKAENEFDSWNHGTIYEVVARLFGDTLPAAELYAIGQEKEAYYRRIFAPHITPLEGLHTWLDACIAANLDLAIATMADMPNVDFTIDGLGVRHYFKAIASAEDVLAGKPAPDIFLAALAKLGLKAENVVAFEDTHSGIRAAREAGLKVIGVATTQDHIQLKEWGAHITIDNYKEVSLDLCEVLLKA